MPLRRLFHPVVVIALASLLMFGARLAVSQQPATRAPVGASAGSPVNDGATGLPHVAVHR